MYEEIVGTVRFDMSKEDFKSNPNLPRMRMYDDDLIGIFNVETFEVLENYDLADYDIEIAVDVLKRNKENYLELWNDYKELFKYA